MAIMHCLTNVILVTYSLYYVSARSSGPFTSHVISHTRTQLIFSLLFTSCDNTPTVSWVNKWSSSRSKVATQLLKIWGSRMVHGNIPPPCIHYLPGKVNTLLDRASREFKIRLPSGNFQTLTDHEFLTTFNADFLLS